MSTDESPPQARTEPVTPQEGQSSAALGEQDDKIPARERPPRAQPEKISLEEIEKAADTGRGAGGKELSALQAVGYKLAIRLLIFIGAASLAIFIVSFFALPRLPTLPDSINDSNTASVKELLQIYQQSYKGATDRAFGLFQLIVASTLLPAFTAILGYIFGTRQEAGGTGVR